jgi:hypothetical protein
MKMLFKNPVLWWRFEGKFYHKDLYRGLVNLFKWFPVIWKDRNWDDSYIFKVLEHKVKLQAKEIGERGNHLSAKRDAEIMMTCVRLMERVREEYYPMEYSDYHNSKYWFEDIKEKPGYSTWEHEILDENFDEYFKKYPLIYKRVINGEGVFNINKEENDSERKKVIAMNISKINHDRARKLLFSLLERNIERWWD